MLASFSPLPALIRSVLGPLSEQKVRQPSTYLPQKQTLRLVQLSFANVDKVNAILGFVVAMCLVRVYYNENK